MRILPGKTLEPLLLVFVLVGAVAGCGGSATATRDGSPADGVGAVDAGTGGRAGSTGGTAGRMATDGGQIGGAGGAVTGSGGAALGGSDGGVGGTGGSVAIDAGTGGAGASSNDASPDIAGGGTGGTGTGGMGTGGAATGGTGTGGGGGGGRGGAAGGGRGGAAGGVGGTTVGGGCAVDNSACVLSAGAGLCRVSACAACTDVADDQACQTAYGSDRLCIGGACVVARCRDSSGCSSGQVCKAAQCAACADATDDNLCGTGRLCLGGACVTADCRTSGNCSTGKLCRANRCQACIDPADDNSCATRYGTGSICNAGTCAQGCRTGSDCGNGQLCKGNVCSGCVVGDTAACVARYGSTSVCFSAACSQGSCATDDGCGGATLCENGSCAPCVDLTDDPRCQSLYGSGRLCVGGSCVIANCHADAACSAGTLCKSSTCTACVDVTDDATCAGRYGAGSICSGGTCRPGCRADAVCGAGQLCKSQSQSCSACTDVTDDGACASRYGAGTVCNAGNCQPGCRADNACSSGQLCETLSCGACIDPNDDGACSARYGANTICRSGSCQIGCRTAAGCSGADTGKLCTGLACTACTESSAGDGACTTQYALQSVCVAGACLPGNCRASSDCVGSNAGFRCISRQCTPCSNDAGCQGDATYGASFLCHTAADNGSGKRGQCVSSTCTTASAVCDSNPSVDYCCPGPVGGTTGNSCVSGTCCVAADCSFGQTCTNHQCFQCNTVSDGNFYVDPANGTDTVGITGSGTCAWQSITFALAQLAGFTQPAIINIKATGNVGTASGETFPLGVSTALPGGGGTFRIVPARRIIKGAGTDVPTIRLPTGQVAFILAAPATTISQLIIDSVDIVQANRGAYGIRVFQGSDATTTIDHVTVRNTQGAGIRVERSAATQATSGVLAVGPGVTVTAAGTSACGGLHILANGLVTLTGGTGGNFTQFINNNGYGICVQDRGQLVASGTTAYPAPVGQPEGTIVIKGNSLGGVSIAQCISEAAEYLPINNGSTPPPAFTIGNCPTALTGLGTPPPMNTLTGVAIWNHAIGTANGLVVTAGSRVTLRSNVVLGNARAGVLVNNGPTYTTAGFNYRVVDLGTIDLGKTGSAGGNVLQIPWGTGSPINAGAGIQLNITAAQAQTLSALGNRLQDDATSSVLVDCSTTTAAVSRNYPSVATCFTTSTKGISVCGNIITGTGANAIDVSRCTIAP